MSGTTGNCPLWRHKFNEGVSARVYRQTRVWFCVFENVAQWMIARSKYNVVRMVLLIHSNRRKIAIRTNREIEEKVTWWEDTYTLYIPLYAKYPRLNSSVYALQLCKLYTFSYINTYIHTSILPTQIYVFGILSGGLLIL